MAKRREVQTFSADDAKSCAHEVVHHDPALPRAYALVPANRTAADAGVTALSAELHALPASIHNALANAESNAGHISEDRLQGLAELIQNADDLGATLAEFTVDEADSRLMFRHNGSGLTLHDVWALAIPWLSLKLDDPDQLGRFGIGLKTLHALSDVLEVHEGHFRVRYVAHDLSAAAVDVRWPGALPQDARTTFMIPLEPAAATPEAVAAWLSRWSDAGLIFLDSLNTVTLLGPAGDELARLHVERAAPEQVKTASGDMTRRAVMASDGREWAVYSRSVPVPKGQARASKTQAKRTPGAIAFSLRGPDDGHLHVGLPVRPIGLPFRLLAQFDPLTSRRDISDDSWNHSLVRPLSALWLDAVLDHFNRSPATAWAAVPLSAELARDEQTVGQLRAELDQHLLADARKAFARRVTLADGGQRYHLADLAYEAPELEGVLTPGDVAAVAGTPGTVAVAVRSADSRWREVLGALREAGAESPRLVEVADAVRLLDEPSRSPTFIADLVAIAAEAGATDALEKRRCLVLDDASRITPLGARGLGVLLPEDTGTLWDALRIGQRLHPAYRQSTGWISVQDWLWKDGFLLRDATDAAALRVLAAAGEKGTELDEPLTDEQADALRAAFEQLSQTDRQVLGAGVGQAVRFAAVTYDPAGKRVTTAARPSEAYIIERDANTWRVAAGKTPGLTWIHSRYSEKLRGDGRDGVGAQRLFRYLGAETAPRLQAHRARTKRFAYAEAGVSRHASNSPPRRNAQMDELKATYTLGELVSPDLDAVLLNIAREKRREDRVRRASAVLNTLNRAWDRLEPHVGARAVTPYYSWQSQGFVDAWWVARAASIPWLTSASGTPAAPDHLRIRTAVTEAFFGHDGGQYLSPRFDTATYQGVLAVLGVEGDPRPDQLLGRLRAIRDKFPAAPADAADNAAPLYRALAAQVRGRGASRRTGSLNLGTLRSEFGRGDGLIATNVGWRRPPVVRRGPAVFGDMLPFVPAVEGTDPLWNALSVRPPDPSDAKDVLRKLARRRSPSKEQLLVMLNALRILARAQPDQVGSLARSSVWVGDRWMSARPVYAVANPLIAKGLSGQIPMWAPGGALAQLDSLIMPYALTRIDVSHAKVKGAEHAEYDAELTSMFSNAVSNLREDLALSDSSSEASLRLSWDDLAAFNVCILPDLAITLTGAVPGTALSFTTRAWIDKDAATFYVSGPDDVGDPVSGAYAVATVFASDTRRIAHDWLAAWAAAMAGHRAEAIKTAASLEAEQKRARAEREAAADAALRQMSQDSERRRQRKPATRPGGGSGESGRVGAPSRSQPPKTLVDLSRLTLANPAGQIVNRPGTASPPTATGAGNVARLLRDADKNRPKVGRPPGSGSAPRHYTQEEQESLGAEICRWVLGLDEDEIADIRNQHNVGADAVDQLDNFYEYKVHAGPVPDVIGLEPSQIERALTTPNFFLVVIGNLQAGVGDPEVRIITNPLDQLVPRPTASVQYSGVLAARALTYRFALDSDASDDPEETDSGDPTD